MNRTVFYLEGYKKVWNVLMLDDLQPEYIPIDREAIYPRTTAEPPSGQGVVITGYDSVTDTWQFVDAGLDEDLSVAISEAVQKAVGLDDETIIQLAQFYPEWTVGTTYSQGDIVRYGDETLWRYHSPDATVATDQLRPGLADYLWTKIVIGDDGVVIWVQPTGYENAYKVGDVVLYKPTSLKYESLIDGNTQEPTKDEPYNRYWKELDK